MWIYEPDSLLIKTVNEAAMVLYGYSKQEMQSLTIKALRSDSKILKLQKDVEKRSQAFNDAGTWLHKKKNGDQIYVKILSYPIQMGGTELQAIVAQDVTKQKMSKNNIKVEYKGVQNRLLLNALFSQSEPVITVKDQDGRYQEVNRKFREYWNGWKIRFSGK